MNQGNTLTNLAVCLSFWIGVVLLLLLAHGELNDRADATPIAADSEKQAMVETAGADDPIETVPAGIPDVPALELTEIAGEIRPGESLDQAMRRLKITDPARLDIIRGFSQTLDFTSLQPGDSFAVQVDRDNAVIRATYISGPLNTHVLARTEDGSYQASRQAVELEYRIERVSGVIESSLYTAFTALGEEPRLIHAYADIFASKIDFNTETRAGDRFELLLEKYYKDGVFVGYGKILVARYQQENVSFEGYHFASENTPPGYFDEKGEALGTWFIRSPIPFGRVTSRFTMRRKHPVDGVIRPHLGVDLAAPHGTPVMATADGKVELIGRKGGFGKTIILRHNGGYKTYYGHLSGFKKGLRQGSFVSQKEVIGYVGSTGISTGPHLDYRIQYNGEFRNPFAIKFKSKIVLQEAELALFRRETAQIAELFNSNTDEKILQVKNVILSEAQQITFL